MKNINLSIDGGGTGIRILAFDEELKLLGRGFSGPVNATFENEEKVGGNISEALKILFDPLPKNLKIHKIF
ncbi:MAG: hypothetical protein FWH48_05065, partial [Oscillospiraceae bacterium]|nr:hypothetical protein [Oscillospiraceae bacterium]